MEALHSNSIRVKTTQYKAMDSCCFQYRDPIWYVHKSAVGKTPCCWVNSCWTWFANAIAVSMNFKLTFGRVFGDELVLQHNELIQHESRQHCTRLWIYNQTPPHRVPLWYVFRFAVGYDQKKLNNSVTKTSTGNPRCLIYTITTKTGVKTIKHKAIHIKWNQKVRSTR